MIKFTVFLVLFFLELQNCLLRKDVVQSKMQTIQRNSQTHL